jgi:hypothetical protein
MAAAHLFFEQQTMRQQYRKLSLLTLQRGPCYGTCPVYQVSVSALGVVTWLGEMFVECTGPASWQLPGSRVAQIERALDRAGFLTFAAAYTKIDVTDSASCDILVEYADGWSKKVAHNHGDLAAPRELFLLERWLDCLIATGPYVGD